jgi:hypothetical protein
MFKKIWRYQVMRQAFGAGNGNLQDEGLIDTRMQKTAGTTEVTTLYTCIYIFTYIYIKENTFEHKHMVHAYTKRPALRRCVERGLETVMFVCITELCVFEIQMLVLNFQDGQIIKAGSPSNLNGAATVTKITAAAAETATDEVR